MRFSGWPVDPELQSKCGKAKNVSLWTIVKHPVQHDEGRVCILMQANQYWRNPFRPVMGSRQLVEFVVLDVEPVGRATERMVQADVQVRPALPVAPFVWCG